MCFFSPVTANCQRKRILRKTDGLCLLRLYFFFLFLSPGKLTAEQTANEKNNNNKEKKKKNLGWVFILIHRSISPCTFSPIAAAAAAAAAVCRCERASSLLSDDMKTKKENSFLVV
jgi:hypothetical protein